MSKEIVLSEDTARRVLEVVDKGLVKGVGKPIPGQMCVEAAVCYAQGLPHGDDPACVGYAVRAFKIKLNDSDWSDDLARGAGMRKVAIAQLGSDEIDQKEFAKRIAIANVREILPIALRGIGLIKEAEACEKATTLTEVQSAAWSSAESARSAAWSAAAWAAESAESAARSAARSAASTKNKVLGAAADLAVKVLVELGAKGTQWLGLCN